ncbi:MAG: aspartate/glutamate racemase family protein [Pseudolabrys sp.]|nr:aspartate/glutamate racemase family protein [Pseudolabrys sp.]
MPKQQRLGLIGGLGVSATIFYYRQLVAALEQQGRTPDLLIAHAEVNRLRAFATAKDYDGVARYLASLAGMLKAGGATVAAIDCASIHVDAIIESMHG